jgi:SOS-response transcriptional repressor LexA
MSPTARQMDALRFVTGYQLAKGYAPTVREIGRGIGSNSTCLTHGFLTALEERGHIRRLFAQTRAIEVLTDIPVPRSPEGEPLYWVRLP